MGIADLLILRQTMLLTFTSYHILLGWGMSELSPLALLNPLHAPRDGSCGIAVPNTVFKVADVSSGENLEPNKEGEICCKGPMVAYKKLKKNLNNQNTSTMSRVFYHNTIQFC